MVDVKVIFVLLIIKNLYLYLFITVQGILKSYDDLQNLKLENVIELLRGIIIYINVNFIIYS